MEHDSNMWGEKKILMRQRLSCKPRKKNALIVVKHDRI